MNIDAMQLEAAQIIRELCAIPAPSHHEEKRAAYCKKWFEENGFAGVSIDSALNVIAPVNVTENNKVVIVMAHTDTVFPDLEPMPFTEKDGFMHSPGVCDDTANLAVMMVCAREFKKLSAAGGQGVLFVANACEEGLGNLKGCRQLMADYGDRVLEVISFDGSRFGYVTCDAVGSHRYQVTIRTEGGHSFGNFGNRNAIHMLSSMINTLYTIKVPVENNSRTTYNVGTISGGTSVNTIAQNAEMLYEYRSNNRNCLDKMKNFFEQTVAAYRAMGITVEVEQVGDRPCAAPQQDQQRFSDLLRRIKSIGKEITGLDYVESAGSTDCNIPLSMGIPAVCIGVCIGTGCHTREESLKIDSLATGCKLAMEFLTRSYC